MKRILDYFVSSNPFQKKEEYTYINLRKDFERFFFLFNRLKFNFTVTLDFNGKT